ncbi:MAG: cytochrome b/b6 domain-containing protein [Phycisphaerae bacterium]|nr:cytochrome b/b6 domain-containing protein [Phycisphaerae bacterium]
MARARNAKLLWAAGLLAGLVAGERPARGADPEGCLICHRYRGLARLESDGRTVRPFHVDPTYYDRMLGPHARLLCTDCHDRSQVEVVPHRPVSPVDCTTTCHLSSAERLEVEFGHDPIEGMLASSVHTENVLTACNGLLGEPLRAGQSRCLLCHEEPMFRRGGHTWADQEAPIKRCDVCHDPSVVGKTRYYWYWHVHARSRPARTNAGMVRLCATCHADQRVRESFELPDSIGSYLASFHGKATLLGSERTAACLDCHVGPMQNVHVMDSRHQAISPTNPKHLADTCRSPRCHPTAGERVSTAAVHLDLGTTRGIEFFTGCLFVLLIIFTFGPSAGLTCLEMLAVVTGRHDPAHKDRLHLAEKLLAEPGGRRLLQRFTPHQRVQHWALAVCFITLVVTGFPMKFADRAWAIWVIEQIGGLPRARLIHRWVGIFLLSGMFYHLCYVVHYLIRQRRRTGKGFVSTFLAMPMVMRWPDVKDLFHLIGFLLGIRKSRPEGGRFSLEEKFEYFGVFWGVMLLGFTGLLMWHNSWTTRYLTGRVLTVASLIHTFEAFLALLHVGIVHMVSVIFSPAVFPVSPAMLTGTTPAEELAEGHSAMLTEAADKLQAAAAGEASHA